MALTPRHVFRYFKTDGVPSSGKHNPVKAEIIQLLEQLFGVSRGGWVVAQTRAALLSVTPEDENDGGVVLDDPNPAYNGYYSRVAGVWDFGRGFPDTFASVTLTGSGTVQTGTVKPGVSPASIEVFFAEVTTPNTGPLRLSIAGVQRDVLNAAENPLSPGEWTGGVMFRINPAGKFQLINEAGAAVAAARSATEADEARILAQAAAAEAGEGVAVVPDRMVLASLDFSVKSSANVKSAGSCGLFDFLVGDFSAEVALDEFQGVFVPPSDDPTGETGVWARQVLGNRYMLSWFLDPDFDVSLRTAVFKSAIEFLPSGSTLVCMPGDIELTEITAAPRGDLTIEANGMRIVNTTQVATNGKPILRLMGDSTNEIEVKSLKALGPRISTDTTSMGTGSAGNPASPGPGFPSGIEVFNFRKALIEDCDSHGTYYNGIEAHYIGHLTIQRNRSENHAYGGILYSDCQQVRVDNNKVTDTGSFAPTYGYGITGSTSANSPSYSTFNDFAVITGNDVSLCKRKGIDVHSGASGVIAHNRTKGCGYSHIEVICEEQSKFVRDWNVHDNHIYGDADLPTTNNGISVGSFGATIATKTNFKVHHNHIHKLVAPIGINVSNGTDAGKVSTTVIVDHNAFSECELTLGIVTANYSTFYKLIYVEANVIDANVSLGHILVRNATRAVAKNNICEGTTTYPTAVAISGTSVHTAGNILNGVTDT